MKTTLYKTINYWIVTLSLFSCISCDFIEIDPPSDRIITSTLFQDEGTATAAVLGLYSELVMPGNVLSNGGTTIYAGLAADELFVTNATALANIQFEQNEIATDNSVVYTNFWRDAYEIIYHTNLCIEGLEASDNLTQAIKDQLRGECHFIRAFCYWYLMQFFGEFPLALSSDYEINRQLPKSDIGVINRQILDDLLQARTLLISAYPSTGKVRVNYYTVLSLLCRYYLYEEDWEEVEKLATEIITSGLYDLESNINSIFLINGVESIWQIESSQSLFNSVEGSTFIPLALPTVRPQFGITEELLSDFEPNDLRRTSWTASKTVTGTTYVYPLKYKIRLNTTKTENYVMFRLGEIYLNRAEARTYLNRAQDALEDLNQIRSRANLPEKTFGNTPELLEAIQKERRIELFAEWGHRWFDLRRTGKIDEVMTRTNPNWKSTASLFPIPQNEILVNPALIQNPGYDN